MPPAFRFASFYIATVRLSRDHFLPPDPSAFLAAEPATGRVIVIAPTRAACSRWRWMGAASSQKKHWAATPSREKCCA